MRRRYETTGLIAEAPDMLQETVVVFSEPEHGAAMRALGNASRRVASCRTRAASSRYKLVILPLGLVDKTNSAVMSYGQGCRQTRLRPVPSRSSHTPPAPRPDVSQNTRWVGYRQTISARCVGLDTT